MQRERSEEQRNEFCKAGGLDCEAGFNSFERPRFANTGRKAWAHTLRRPFLPLVLLFIASSRASLMLTRSFTVWSERTFNTAHSENWCVGVVIWVNVTSLSEMNAVFVNPQIQYRLHRRII